MLVEVEHIGLIFFGVSLLLIVGMVVRRASIVRKERRHGQAAARLRPQAIAYVESDDAEPPQLRGRDADVFAGLLGGYGRLLRGPAAARIAAYLDERGAVDRQLRRLESRRSWRRAAAAFELGDMRAVRATPQLLGALEDRSRDVRMAAARSLGRVGAVEAVGPLIAVAIARRVPSGVAGLALLDIGPAAVPRLLELTGDPNPNVRAGAIELVGLLGNAGEAAPLRERMTDPAAAVRAATATALGRLGAENSRDLLVQALDDRLPAVRTVAAEALGRTGDRTAADALLLVARNDEFEPARAAARSLARIDPARVVAAAAEPEAGPHLVEQADRIAL